MVIDGLEQHDGPAAPPMALASRPRANSRTDNLLRPINIVAPPEHIWRCGRLRGLSMGDPISNPRATRIVVLLKAITGLLASSGITYHCPNCDLAGGPRTGNGYR